MGFGWKLRIAAHRSAVVCARVVVVAVVDGVDGFSDGSGRL